MPAIFRVLPLVVLALAPSVAAAEPGATATVIVDPGPPPSAAVLVTTPPPPPELGRIRHRHRLHIDTDLFAWRRWAGWNDEASDDDRVDSLSILGGVPLYGSPGGVGGPTGNVKAGYAYGLTDRVLLGFRLGLGWQRLSSPGTDAASGLFSASFVPYFEFVFRPGRAVRPFLGARVGLIGASVVDRDGDTSARVGTIGPTMGVLTGLHAFIGERVSLDPGISFDYQLAYARSRTEAASTGFESLARIPNLAVTLGLSVWLGRDRESRMTHRRGLATRSAP
jgi:hypothetical protein